MSNNSHLTVYKASAGSGKTFRLAVQYITLLIENPQNYRHILAVTFTNKATAEMKQRILSQLYGISKGLETSQSYYDEVCKTVKKSEADIRENARTALNNILQDYGRFRVETIDSFFQTVLRSLARELGQGGNLNLELDTDAAIDEAVDSFLANVEKGSDDKRNIMKFVEDNIENDKSWSIDKTLKKFAKELFNEVFMESGKELRRKITEDPDAVSNYMEKLVQERDRILTPMMETITGAGNQIESKLKEFGFDLSILSSRPQGEVKKLINGTVVDDDLKTTFINCIERPELFFTADTKKHYPFLVKETDQFGLLFKKVQDIHPKYVYKKNSFDAAIKYMHELSLLLSIRKEIDDQSKEQNRFILADTPQLLHSMEQGDTSFIFEKTGSFISHLMIDEFQDTSGLQWSNLYLLLLECLSTNNDSLVVGDVKQSIYRWRNSDWNILNTKLEEQLAIYNPNVVQMDSNRRSSQQVIEFNNALFPKAVQILAQHYEDETGLKYPDLEQAYKGVEQNCIKKDGSGYVYAETISATGLRNDELRDLVCPKIADQLDKLTAAGVLPADIAILCRKKDRIADIAEWFAKNRSDYRMISSEAFQLDSSVAVRILVNTMRWLSDSTDRISLAQSVWEWERAVKRSDESFDRIYARGLERCLPEALTKGAVSLRNLPLYELTENLYSILDLSTIQGQDQYMMAFQDTVCQWLSRNPGDLAEFLTEWDEKLYKTPIPATDINGIRLLTIHKSKGLEFHTVIVPFCDWPVIDSGGFNEKRMWVKPLEEPYNGMPFIPIGFGSRLKNSVFQNDYNHEAGLQTVDNLNLLYVALTRAKKNLIVLCNHPYSGYSICNPIEECLGFDPFNGTINDDGIIYETGQICPHKEDDKKENLNPLETKPDIQELKLKSYPINAQFLQSGEASRFVYSDDENGSQQQEYIDTGKLMHELFAAIRTVKDIDPQIDIMLSKGLLASKEEASKLKERIHGYIESRPEVKAWFNSDLNLFNEVSIVFRNGNQSHTLRPDRVMITPDDRAIVVDFKFGVEHEGYLHQVQEYMDLLREMGYAQVKGYIWYVYNNKIINC